MRPFRDFDRETVPATSLTTSNTVVSENLDRARPTRVMEVSRVEEVSLA